MDSFTGTMVSHHIKIPSRYRTVPWPFTQNLIVSHDQNHDLKFRHAIRPEPWSLSHRTISNSVTLHEPNHDPNSVTLHDPRRARHGAVSGWVRQRHGCLSGKGASTARVQYRGINPYYGLQQNGSYLHHLLDMAPIKCFHITLQLAISDCMLWPSDVLHLFRALEDQMLLSWRITRQFWICHFFEIVRNSSPERPVSIPRSIWWFTKFQSVSQQLSI